MLNHQKRTIIIANDNRAVEISKDTGLPVIHLNDMENRLVDVLNQKRKQRKCCCLMKTLTSGNHSLNNGLY